MSDYKHNFIISLNDASKYWKSVELVSILVMLILKSTNPIFKISLALHIGLQSMLILLYSPLVYYKSSIENDSNSINNGILQKIIGFIPNLIKSISIIGLKIFLKLINSLNFVSLKHEKLNITKLGLVLSYFLITLRKMIALLVSIYVTSIDDESTHRKAFIIFIIFISIQIKFINDLTNEKLSSKYKNLKLPLVDTFKILFKSQIDKVNNKNGLLFISRKRISLLTILLSIFSIYYTITNITEVNDNDLIWEIIMKSFIILDSVFVTTLLVELSGLDLYFNTSNDTFV